MALNAWSDPLPPGRHHVEVDDVQEAKSKSSGQKMWRVRLKVLGGMDTLTDVIMHEGGGLKMSVAKLQALGVRKEMLPLEGHMLIGRRAYINVTHELYQGEMQAKIVGPYEVDPEQQPIDWQPAF